MRLPIPCMKPQPAKELFPGKRIEFLPMRGAAGIERGIGVDPGDLLSAYTPNCAGVLGQDIVAVRDNGSYRVRIALRLEEAKLRRGRNPSHARQTRGLQKTNIHPADVKFVPCA